VNLKKKFFSPFERKKKIKENQKKRKRQGIKREFALIKHKTFIYVTMNSYGLPHIITTT